MSSNQKKKVVKYRRPLNLNIGMLIFGFIFVYILISVITYFRTEHIVSYEVNSGSLSTSNTYTGIAIREEKIVTSGGNGYVNYFAREGEKIGTNRLVYTIDSSGKLAEMMASSRENNQLTQENLLSLRQECISFTAAFSQLQFESAYSFKYSMEGSVLQLASTNTLENIGSLNSSGVSNSVQMYYAAESGIVVYSVDGYEELTPEQVSAEVFDKNTYQKKMLLANELLEQGNEVYKLCTSENWSIVIPLSDTQAEQLMEESYVKVRFLKNQTESWAQFSILNNADGKYGLLNFNNSMINFCTERFLDIELIVEEENGLKIPVSSIVEKEFYLIPLDYVITEDDGKSKCVFRQVYTENGGLEWSKVTVSVYAEVDDYAYISEDILQGGDVLQKADSSEEETVSKRGTLIGVYNIDKGYADFRQITILYQNDDYAIVKSNTTYGLREYDHIVLDASAVSDDDFMK